MLGTSLRDGRRLSRRFILTRPGGRRGSTVAGARADFPPFVAVLRLAWSLGPAGLPRHGCPSLSLSCIPEFRSTPGGRAPMPLNCSPGHLGGCCVAVLRGSLPSAGEIMGSRPKQVVEPRTRNLWRGDRGEKMVSHADDQAPRPAVMGHAVRRGALASPKNRPQVPPRPAVSASKDNYLRKQRSRPSCRAR